MLTETKATCRPEVPVDIEEVEYPPEVVARWDARAKDIKRKLATGELVPKTVEELTEELGIDKVVLTEEDDEGGYLDENGNVINPDDYDNETDYINAIPGMADYLIKMTNAPDGEFTPVPEEWFNVSG